MFPDDETLLARGKFSTLNREWREQMKRVQDTANTIRTQLLFFVEDCQVKPPANGIPLAMIEKCVENLRAARERLITLSLGMNELESEAWPK